MDEFKDEQKFKQLTPEQIEAWIMVSGSQSNQDYIESGKKG